MPFDGPIPSVGIAADFWSLRFVRETCESFAVRKNVPLPYAVNTDTGVMATVYVDGGYGYAATADLSPAGLRDALERAARWARVTARHALFDSRALPRPAPQGEYRSPSLDTPLPSRREWYDLLLHESQEAAMNFLKPGEEMLLPNAVARKRGFEYVATPPLGPTAVVAILSDRRVQILDLPDTSQKTRSEAETVA